jgi:hypothetical protein
MDSCHRGSRLAAAGLALLMTLSLAATPALGAGERAQISDLTLSDGDGQLLVSFRLLHAFSDSTLERIQSGLPTGFTYKLVMERERNWWFDKRVERTDLDVVAMYNAITREYLVNYKQDGRLVDSRVVTSPEDLRRAMTIFHAWPAFELDRDFRRNLVVKIQAELGSKTILALFPTTVRTRWLETERFLTADRQIVDPENRARIVATD